MVSRDFDDFAIGKDPFHLAHEIVPFVRSMEIVEVDAAAAQHELPQNRDVAVVHLQKPGLDEIDPRIFEEAGIVERQHNRIFHLNRGCRLHTARQVLLCGGGVDIPGLAVELLRHARAFGDVVVLHAHEAPLEAGEAIVGRGGQLRIDGGLHRGRQGQQREEDGDEREPVLGHHCRPPSTSFNSSSCARSYDGAISSAASVCFFASAFFPLFQ